jgi:hypothetical protein
MKEIKLQDAINLNNVLSKLNEIIDTFYDED